MTTTIFQKKFQDFSSDLSNHVKTNTLARPSGNYRVQSTIEKHQESRTDIGLKSFRINIVRLESGLPILGEVLLNAASPARPDESRPKYGTEYKNALDEAGAPRRVLEQCPFRAACSP